MKKMKKIVALLLMFVMMLSVSSVSLASEQINVTINGIKQNYDVMPVIVNDRTLVPMRGIFEALGAKVGWVDYSKTVTGTRNNKTVKLKIDDYLAYIDGEEFILDVPATIVNGRTMVPVRFISEMLGEKVEWDADTKTVVIESDFVSKVANQPGLKPLTNNIHRNIPKDFKSSSSFDDITYYEHKDAEPFDFSSLKNGKTILTIDDIFKSKVNNEGFSTLEKVEQDGNTVARFSITQNPGSSSKCIYKFDPISGYVNGTALVLKFDARLASEIKAEQVPVIQFQLEEQVSGKHLKNIWETVNITSEWETYYIVAEALDGYDYFGIRPGGEVQTVEIKNFSLVNYPDYPASQVPKPEKIEYAREYSSKDAQWRKEALERIEQHRKGDFKVVVKDKEGNVIPDAKVNFDMFESEFMFGTSVTIDAKTTDKYLQVLGEIFNSAVNNHYMKWAPYLLDPQKARDEINGAKKAGIKNIRGHVFVWEKRFGSDGKTNMTPEIFYNPDGTIKLSKEELQQEVKNHILKLSDEFAGEITEWDVMNEIADNTDFRGTYGNELMKDWYDWARMVNPDVRLFYNEGVTNMPTWEKRHQDYMGYVKYLHDNNIDLDAIGMQSHMEWQPLRSPESLYDECKSIHDMGFKTSVTEYTYAIEDDILQAEYSRDYFILTFSMPEMTGFTTWGFWDGRSHKPNTPYFNKDWTLSPCGEQLIDLMYNKFWTHDAKATTNEKGEAAIRGFYGDYDVTVEANGKTKTLSCSYHKGYDNVLEFVID